MTDASDFERAIDENPLNADTHLMYSDWLRDNGQEDEADFRKAMGEWVRRGENVIDRFRPPGDDPKAFAVFDPGNDGFTHSIYHAHIPEWGRSLLNVGENHHGMTLADPSIAYHPNQYWYHWRGYRPMEECLRKAFMHDASMNTKRMPRSYSRAYRSLRRK